MMIHSASNPRYRRLRALLDSARERRREAATVLEGIHLVDAWLSRHGAPQVVAVGRRGLADPAVGALLARAGGEPMVLADPLFDALGTMPSPVPVLAVVTLPACAALAAGVDTVVLDRIQDPANVGAIIRTAAAAGIAQLVTLAGTASCWSPKALRAGMGGQFALSIIEGVEAADALALIALPVAGTVVRGGTALHAADLRPPLAWVFGHEGEGLDRSIAARLDRRLTIPQSDAVESLNVAAAVAVCLFEQRRQRLDAGLSCPSGFARSPEGT